MKNKTKNCLIILFLLLITSCSKNLSLSKMSLTDGTHSVELIAIQQKQVTVDWALPRNATAQITLSRISFPDRVFSTSSFKSADQYIINQIVPDTDYKVDVVFTFTDGKKIAAASKNFKTLPIPGAIELKTADIFPNSGFSYGVPLPHRGDSGTFPTISKLKLYEDGIEMNLAHQKHVDIANIGQGRFSHWDREIYFSASDNSSPLTNKKKYHYVYIVPTIPESPMGYVSLEDEITGGSGGETVTVSNIDDFYDAVIDDLPRVVQVSGTITGSDDYMIAVGSNKTIIGVAGAEIKNQGLYVWGKQNVIFKNLKIYDGDGEYSPIAIKEFAKKVWIDHCEFYPSSNPDNGHTMTSVTKSADLVTYSWNKFYGKYTGILIGGSPLDMGPFRVTIHHNLFENMLERQPTVRNGFVHVFNNYYKDAMTDGHMPVGITAITNATIRTDANFFENFPGHAITTQYDPANETDGFISGLNTNFKDSIGVFNITTPESFWLPPYSYDSYLHDVNDVPEVVMNGAGVK